MRYVFYIYEKYAYQQLVPTRNLPLHNLFDYLDNPLYYFWIWYSDDNNDPNKIVIWLKHDIKEFSFSKKHNSYEDYENYSNQYAQYWNKRFAEMPAIRISRDNYKALRQQFQNLYDRTPQYLILREHDNGEVDMLEQSHLSVQDLIILNREHTIYQNYIKRWNQYVKDHPEKRSLVWDSPADNEFESDFALYDPVDEQGVE